MCGMSSLSHGRNEQFQVVDEMSSLSYGWNEQSAMW